MVKRIYDTLNLSGIFEQTVIYSKYQNLMLENCIVERDTTEGTLLDSIISAIGRYGEFLAIGGDMPLLNKEVLLALLSQYRGEPLAAIGSNGTVEPLLAVYNRSIYDDLLSFSLQSKRIFAFIEKRFRLVRVDQNFEDRLLNVNTEEDLEIARRLVDCPAP